MKGVHPISANGLQNGEVGPEAKLEAVHDGLNIKVAHGPDEHDVALPPNSTFGDLKSIIVRKIGLNPETHKLLFRGKEKEDDESLQTAGVKDNAKVLLVEEVSSDQKIPDEVKETNVVSRGVEAVAKVREEVDKLADQVRRVQSLVETMDTIKSRNSNPFDNGLKSPTLDNRITKPCGNQQMSSNIHW
ncbi:BCL-2-associated athanogene 2 [Striga asiatica]|uniref:BCL-2-associated athanogene 2 n=1 Tax=Striga asiatica TaxID=4170 RepID=A0A5A7RE21_STRAF|nr:BCL-2-associated athanogene 2 [Striga asiatica]